MKEREKIYIISIIKSYQMLSTYLSDFSPSLSLSLSFFTGKKKRVTQREIQPILHFYSNKKLFQSRKMLISFSCLFKWKSSKVSLRFYKFTYKFSHDSLFPISFCLSRISMSRETMVLKKITHTDGFYK